jgi:hypothetical protein
MSDQHSRIAASYARGAIEDDPQRIANQHSMLADRATRHGFTIPNRYRFSDDGMWSGVTLQRPGFSAMIAAACRGEFSRLYVTEPSRLGRWVDLRFHWHLRALLSILGFEIIFASHDITEVRP